MEKKVFNCIMLDLYGEFLTSRQREMADLCFNQDMSLSEIAAEFGITRQGVRDALQRAERTLSEMEDKLHLAQRELSLRAGIGQCRALLAAGDYEALETQLERIENELQS